MKYSRPQSKILLTLVALLFMSVTVATRLPFVSHRLYAWDSANFALAMSNFNVTFHQPQPPGYPLYVGAAKLVNLLVADPNLSLVYVGIGSSALAVAMLFLLASAMYGLWIGLVAGGLLTACVGFWGYGEVAYPYTALAFFGSLIAWLCFLMWQGHRSVAVLSALLLGISAGVRTDTLLFLAPLWLVSVWRLGLMRTVLSCIVLGLTVGAWLVPAVQLSGGWAAYQQANSSQSDYILSTYSVFVQGGDGLRRNTETLLTYLKQMFGIGLVITAYFLGRFLTLKALVVDNRLWFLLLWLAPPLLVYALIHVGDPGYLLSVIPGLCIVTAAGIADVAYDARSALTLLAARRRWLGFLGMLAPSGGLLLAALITFGILLWNVDAFLATPGPARYAEIKTIDAILDSQLGYAGRFQQDSVVILAKDRFRQTRYYLPGYDVQLLYDEYQPGYREARYRYVIPKSVRTVLVMDFGKAPTRFPGVTGAALSLGTSSPVGLWQFEVQPGDTIEYGYDYFGVSGRS